MRGMSKTAKIGTTMAAITPGDKPECEGAGVED